MTEQPSGEIILYQREDGSPAIDVRFEGDSLWVTQTQLVELFHCSKANISEHIKNIFGEGELAEEATVRDFRTVRQEGSRQVERAITYYNLDVILSVGYRVRSKVATRFRIWATNHLRDYLVDGAAINHERLTQLGSIVQLLSRSTDELVAGIADVVSRYLPGLRTLRDYDAGTIPSSRGGTPKWTLSYDEARSVIDRVGSEFPDDTLFGSERGEALKGVVETIYQGFAGQEIYPSVQDKAVNLLYLVVKDHPLSDGNKRSAAALFVYSSPGMTR